MQGIFYCGRLIRQKGIQNDQANQEANSGVKTEETKPANEKKAFLSENAIEIITVILLGITALLTAWASYAGSIHGGSQRR